ncbi:MAG: hypothetical protein WDZ28_03070 [Simkaniaceae bacterium]
MGKLIKWLLLLFVILFILAFFAWNMLPTWVASTLSKRAGVTVSIGDLRPDLHSITIDNFYVGNPRGRVLPRALFVQRTFAKVPITEFLNQDIVIPYMNLQNIYVGVEFDNRNSQRGNWTQIMGTLSQSVGPKTKDKRNQHRTVLIQRLLLENLNIELAYTNERGKTTRLKPIQRIELKNVSSEGGIPTAQIMDIIIKQALREIFSIENLQNMLQNILAPDKKGGIRGLKGLFGENEIKGQVDEEESRITSN